MKKTPLRNLMDLAGHWIIEAVLWLGFAYAALILVGCLLGVLFA